MDKEIMASRLPPSAVPLKKAFSLFASPDRVAEERRLKEERQRYPARIRYRSRYLHGSKVDLDNQRAHRADQLEQALQANSRAGQRDLIDELRDGRLVGYARADTFDEWERVPLDAWGDLKVDIRKSRAEDQNGKVYSVRVATAALNEGEKSDERDSSQDDLVIAEPLPADGPVEIAFDTNRKRPQLVISGVCVFSQANYKLIKALYDLTHEEQHGAIPADKRQFISSHKLADVLGLNDATVRARVTEIRRKLAAACPERFGSPDQKQLLIESHRRSGYRFHWAVRFIPLDQAIRINPQRKSSKTATQENDGR